MIQNINYFRNYSRSQLNKNPNIQRNEPLIPVDTSSSVVINKVTGLVVSVDDFVELRNNKPILNGYKIPNVAKIPIAT